MKCVRDHGLGEEAQQETQEETEQDYLQDASDFQQVGNARWRFNATWLRPVITDTQRHNWKWHGVTRTVLV